MKIHFILNPRSGRRGRTARLLPLLREFIATRRLNAELSITTGPGHARDLARRAAQAGCARIVAVGGDGTMNEVAQALVDSPAALALVPAGSGNGLAGHLHLPTSPLSAFALAVAAEARVAAVDVGTANGRPFFNVMGLGFDAEVSEGFGRSARRGLPAYAGTVLTAFWRRRGERCRIVAGSAGETIEVLLIAVANSDRYGNGAIIAPGARVDDGLLDLVAVPPVGPLGALGLAARLFLGTLDRAAGIRRLRGARFVIERAAPGLIHTDGECHLEGRTVEIGLRPGGLRVVVPPDAPLLRPRPAAAAGGA